MLNKNLATVLAILLGNFGLHHFYVGKHFSGVLQFLFFMCSFIVVGESSLPFAAVILMMSVIIPVMTGLSWMVTNEETWRKTHDPKGYEQMLHMASHKNPGATYSPDFKTEGLRYYRAADYDLAAEAFMDAVSADLSDPGNHFNLACSYAQLGRYPEALQHLELSVTFGLPKPQRIEKHPALQALRKLPAFQTFRANNYRRQDHVDGNISAHSGDATIPLEKPTAPPTATSAPVNETFKDFNTPPPSPPPPTEPQTEPMNVDLLEQISRLRELHDAGILTAGEYQVQKERLLA